MNPQDEIKLIAQEVFNSYDTNKNGVIEKSELKHLLDDISKRLNLPKANNKDILDGLKKIDSNSDGVLQFEEFLPFYRDIYEALKSSQ